MSKLSQFGAHFSENLKRADDAARRLEEKMREPGFHVSEAAKTIELSDKVAQQLGQALVKAMGGGGTYGGYRFEAQGTYDLATEWYTIKIINRSFERNTSVPTQMTWVVGEETLARNTQSVDTFNAWVQAVAKRLTMFFDPPGHKSVTREDSYGWTESLLVKDIEGHVERLAKAKEDLLAYGFREWVQYDGARAFSWEPTPEDLAREEQAAIESIRKAMGNGAE